MTKTITKPKKATAKNKVAKTASSKKKHLFEVGDSGIHGKGLFAARKITKGKVIGTYDGPKVHTDAEDGDHVLWIEDVDGSFYGIDGQNELRYVNHSTKANASFEGEELTALRDIKKGEELTHHYGDDWMDL